MRYSVLLIISLSHGASCYASLEGELEKFFDNFSEVNNISGPSAYKGQSGGYYTGGSIFAKTSSRNIHPLTVQLPHYSAGCGGIDLYTGGFSYISSDELVKMMRNIGNNAYSLAFAIGWKTLSPLVASEAELLNQWAQNVNQFNINSCETAAIGLGMIWPQTHATQDVLCRTSMNKRGESSSYFDSRVQCNAKSSSSIPDASNPISNLNMAWKVIKKSPFFGNDNEFSEFLMSLSGTIIFSEDAQNNQNILELPSLAAHSQLLRAIVNGGEATVYKCDTYEPTKCLHPTLKSLKISSDKALGSQITKALNEMVYAMEHDKELEPAQQALLNSTAIPIYRILNVHTTFAPATKIMDIHYYSELIAYDLLYYFLVDNIKNVEDLSRSQLDIGKIGSEFFANMQKAREQVDRERARAAQQANHVLSLIEKAKTVEKEIASQYSAGMKNSANSMQR